MAKPANASNQFNPDIVNGLLRKIDGYDADLASEKGSYMSRCRNIRENIKAVFDDGKAQGIPQKELRTLVKIRKHEKASEKLFHELESDQQINLQMLAATEKVADLPLWRSAAERKSVPGVDVDAPTHKPPMFN